MSLDINTAFALHFETEDIFVFIIHPISMVRDGTKGLYADSSLFIAGNLLAGHDLLFLP
jgi:hypothetical protein